MEGPMGKPSVKKLVQAFQEYARFGQVVLPKNRELYSHFLEHTMGSEDYSPVFFLSTGRTGTKLFTHLLKKDHTLFVNHGLKPELIRESRIVYENYRGRDQALSGLAEEALFLLGRGEMMYESHVHHKRYVETNNRIGFFTHTIKTLFKNVKFVHLYRHPGEFIRSGMRRHWYSDRHIHDIGRIVPVQGSYEKKWPALTPEEKIAWLWMETNQYFEEQLAGLDPSRVFRFNFNELSTPNVSALCSFLNVSLSSRTIEKAIGKPVNVQTENRYDPYLEWSEEMKQKVEAICGPLMNKYAYSFYK
jgi:hypothetical protein